MGYFVGIAIVLMAIFSLNYLTKIKFAIVFPIVNLSIIFILYIFGLFGALIGGAIFIAVASVAMFIVALVLIIKNKDKQFIKEFFNPAVILLLVFCLAQFVMLFAYKPNWWDELSHWGLVVKNMYYQKDFGGGLEATTMFKGYPVGTSLYLYFFQVFGFEFFDGALIMALNILNISLLMPALSKIEESGKKVAVALCGVAIMFVMHYLFLLTICNDMFLSLCFAFILIMYFCFKREGLKVENYLGIFLAMFALCIAKSTGLALVGFACLIIFVDIFISNGFKNCFKQKGFYCFLFGTITTIVASKLSWSLYLKWLNNPEAWQTSELTIKNILMYIVKPTKYQLKVTGKYFLNLLVPIWNKGDGGVNRVPLIVYILAIIWLIKRVGKIIGNKEARGLYITIFTSFAVWIIALLILYIFTFTEREALSLSSQLRYVNCIGIGFISFLLSYNIALRGVADKFNLSPKLIGAGVSLMVGLCVILCPVVCKIVDVKYSEFEQFEQYISRLDEDDRVYIIDCETETELKYVYRQSWKQEQPLKKISHKKGLRALTMRYIATPLVASGMNVGGSPHSGDVWVDDMSADETKQVILLGKYNYLYIHNITEDFVENYGELFNQTPKERSLYKIIWDDEELILERC